MRGKPACLKPLELRKQLLVAESELNRAQLAEDLAALKAEIHTLTHRAGSFGVIASSAATLMSGLAAFKRRKPGGPDAKASWPQSILKGAGVVSNLWLAFRSRSRNREEN
jgi:hypothetical protein